MPGDEKKGHVIDIDRLPEHYPTQHHSKDFWEALGRCVATFGFLEETLGKAIFSFTATREYRDEEIQEVYRNWLPTLERALSDPLGALITNYAKVVRDHGTAEPPGFDDLIGELRKASKIRNVLCHGSWYRPDEHGRSRPFFVTREREIFEDDIDVDYLEQVQRGVAVLASLVVSTVTIMGWQFPGTRGPGKTMMKAVASLRDLPRPPAVEPREPIDLPDRALP